MDQLMTPARVRFRIGAYWFEYDRRMPRWGRWTCESNSHGCAGRPSVFHAWIAQRRWERERRAAHA